MKIMVFVCAVILCSAKFSFADEPRSSIAPLPPGQIKITVTNVVPGSWYSIEQSLDPSFSNYNSGDQLIADQMWENYTFVTPTSDRKRFFRVEPRLFSTVSYPANGNSYVYGTITELTGTIRDSFSNFTSGGSASVCLKSFGPNNLEETPGCVASQNNPVWDGELFSSVGSWQNKEMVIGDVTAQGYSSTWSTPINTWILTPGTYRLISQAFEEPDYQWNETPGPGIVFTVTSAPGGKKSKVVVKHTPKEDIIHPSSTLKQLQESLSDFKAQRSK